MGKFFDITNTRATNFAVEFYFKYAIKYTLSNLIILNFEFLTLNNVIKF